LSLVKDATSKRWTMVYLYWGHHMMKVAYFN
jgi:hypothetical protein